MTDRAGVRLGRALDALIDVVGSDRQTSLMVLGLTLLGMLILTAKSFYRLLTL
ncbi:hypothetical protein [Roseomonas populi]|uniref:Uncharacterized protein n=1 Tax=Roseomonas populi TaxID=3121582 RepID=A0ABT1X046_9PROT|nr:hypothetical protein [Roseomonas pecuniae]MCR0981470.1 hypothetical protein [Roseomonas pecuniae]